MRGRKPQPTVLKILRGNPGRRKLNALEPQPSALSTVCPSELTNVAAQDEWDARIVPAIQRGQITSADFAAAVAHCELYADWRECWVEAQQHARVITVGKQPQPNPYRSEARKIRAELWKVDAELGFTPVSRSRVQVSKDGPKTIESKWAGLL
jgi:P27 family predicted phage terminase small subunit